MCLRLGPHTQKLSPNERQKDVLCAPGCSKPASLKLRMGCECCHPSNSSRWSKRARMHTTTHLHTPWAERHWGNLGQASQAHVAAPQGARMAVLDSCPASLDPFPSGSSPRVSNSQDPTAPARTLGDVCQVLPLPGGELFCLPHFKGGFHASELWASLHSSALDGRAPAASAHICRGLSATSSAAWLVGTGGPPQPA